MKSPDEAVFCAKSSGNSDSEASSFLKTQCPRGGRRQQKYCKSVIPCIAGRAGQYITVATPSQGGMFMLQAVEILDQGPGEAVWPPAPDTCSSKGPWANWKAALLEQELDWWLPGMSTSLNHSTSLSEKVSCDRFQSALHDKAPKLLNSAGKLPLISTGFNLGYMLPASVIISVNYWQLVSPGAKGH